MTEADIAVMVRNFADAAALYRLLAENIVEVVVLLDGGVVDACPSRIVTMVPGRAGVPATGDCSITLPSWLLP